jgi:hypothetical protein
VKEVKMGKKERKKESYLNLHHLGSVSTYVLEV